MPACKLDSPRLGVFLHFDWVDVSQSVKTPLGCGCRGLTSSWTLLHLLCHCGKLLNFFLRLFWIIHFTTLTFQIYGKTLFTGTGFWSRNLFTGKTLLTGTGFIRIASLVYEMLQIYGKNAFDRDSIFVRIASLVCEMLQICGKNSFDSDGFLSGELTQSRVAW